MFQTQIRRQTVTQIFFLLLIISIGVGMTGSVSADSGPLFDDGIISGQIVDSAGVGIQGLSVSIEIEDAYEAYGRNGAETDVDGNFTIENITRGRYRLRIQDYLDRYGRKYAGGGLQSSSAAVIEVVSNEPIVVNEVLEPAATISGFISVPSNVTDSKPLVTAFYFDNALGIWVDVDTYYDRVDGHYVLGGLAAGDYVIGAYEYFDNDFQTTYFPEANRLEDATPVSVKAGGSLTDVDFSIATRKNAPGGQIRGRVVSAETGTPLSNIAVHLHTHGVAVDPWINPSDYTTTDANGEYEFFTLQPDNYKVAFSDYKDIYADQHNGNKPTLGGAPELTVDVDTRLTVNVEMDRGATVSVAFDSTTDKWQTSAYVTAFRWNEHDAWLPVSYGSNDSGAVEVTALPTGNYVFFVRAEFGWDYSFTGWYGDADTMEEAEQVWIEAGSDVTLETVVFGKNNGKIEGQVLLPDGTPMNFAYVEILSVDPSSNLSVSVRTYEKGRFTSPPLPVGEYKIRVRVQGDTYLSTWYGDAVRQSDAAIVEVGKSDGEPVQITMKLAGKISGSVTTPSNFWADYVSATAYRFVDGEWQRVRSAKVQKDNTYLLGSMPADDYIIYFSAQKNQPYPHPAFEFGEWYGDVASRNDAVKITLSEGEHVKGIDAQLGNIIGSQSRTDGVISGKVVSAIGQSLDGLEVRLYGESSAYRGSRRGAFEMMVPVDAEGNYVFGSLPHGRYIIGFYDTTNQHQPEYYDNVSDIKSAVLLTISAETPTFSSINAVLQVARSRIQ